MLRASLVVIGFVLCSSGLALAQPPSVDLGPAKPPPKMPGPHHPPPPVGPAALQGKGFDLHFGHGRGLRVQCGDEPLKSCIEAARPLIHQLVQSNEHAHRGGSWKHRGHPTGSDTHPGSSQGQDAMGHKPAGSSDQPAQARSSEQ